MIQIVLNDFLHFPRKRFQLRCSKKSKKVKNTIFKRGGKSFFTSRWLQNHFLKSFLWPNLDLNSTLCLGFPESSFNFVTQKFAKKLKNTIRYRTFLFDLKIALKWFSEMLHMTKFWFKQLLTLCLAFPESGFHFVTQKFAEIWKTSFSKVHFQSFKGFFKNICFSTEGSFKMIF